MRKVLIGIPNKGDIKMHTQMSLFMTLPEAENYGTVILAQQGPALDFNRNWICWMALKQCVDYVCFIDTDMVFPTDTINRLMALKKPVVGVASRKKKMPLEFTVGVEEPGNSRTISEAEMPAEPFSLINGYPITIGTGVMLIDLAKVNGIVAKPWFKLNAFWNEGEEPGYMGEDIYFCRKVWNAGLEVWCDPTIAVKHIGDFEY